MKKYIVTLVVTLLLSSSMLSGKTLVTVNGNKIDDSIIPAGYEKLGDEKRANLMEHLIKEELIHAYLLKSSIVQSSEFKKIFSEQKKMEQKQSQKASGKDLTKAQIRNIKGSVALILYQSDLFQKTKVSDAQTKEFYDNNQDKFNLPNSIEIANIVLKTEKEAKSIIKKLKKAKKLNEEFVKIVKEHKQNGYIGWIGEGMAPKNLFDTVYKSQAKRLISEPIQTKHGFNVIYLLNKKAAGKLSYRESKEDIKKMLKQKAVIETLKNRVEELYGNSEIVY